MRRLGPPLVALVLLGSGCTGSGSPPPVPSRSPTTPTPAPGPSTRGPTPPETPGGRSLVLDVVADVTPSLGAARARNTYLDGMEQAVADVNAAGGVDGIPLELAFHDDEGDPERASQVLGEVLDTDPLAVLFVGPGPSLTPLRSRIEESGTSVLLLEGDLYTGRGLFDQVFQTTIPWEWQADVIARYVVTDRHAGDVVFLGEGPEAPGAMAALASALEYWGGTLGAGFTDEDREPTAGLARALGRAASADWTVVFGGPIEVLDLVNAVEEEAGLGGVRSPRPPPGVTGPASLLVPFSGLASPEPGTSGVYTYTWAGWAEPIDRVGTFRDRFQGTFGRLPGGLEQEGYDAVRVLRWALRQTGGEGGQGLVESLETVRDLAFSSFPVDLGPDDHLFLPRDQLGLFAVAGPRERVDPWQLPGSRPWRALMRTFTYDGERDNILDRDRPVFFPFWGPDQPGPKYWRSRYGIVSRPSDALH
jgi:ABC-type branched-subunit amino acid transport system substrate-binding protein